MLPFLMDAYDIFSLVARRSCTVYSSEFDFRVSAGDKVKMGQQLGLTAKDGRRVRAPVEEVSVATTEEEDWVVVDSEMDANEKDVSELERSRQGLGKGFSA